MMNETAGDEVVAIANIEEFKTSTEDLVAATQDDLLADRMVAATYMSGIMTGEMPSNAQRWVARNKYDILLQELGDGHTLLDWYASGRGRNQRYGLDGYWTDIGELEDWPILTAVKALSDAHKKEQQELGLI